MKIVLYEDRPGDFYPLFNLFPQYMLWIGGRSIVDHVRHWFPRAQIILVPRNLKRFDVDTYTGTVIYLSGRCVLTKKCVFPRTDCALMCNKAVVGLVSRNAPHPKNMKELMEKSGRVKTKNQLMCYYIPNIWDLIRLNTKITEVHAKTIRKQGSLPRGVIIIGNKKEVYVKPNAVLHQGVTLDVSNGPIVIGSHAHIRPGSIISGPSFIGSETIVDRAKITASSVGPACRIGGEVEECIFQGYANKYHEGFIGHSYIGAWVNLGALTTNSDLKNNYGKVRIVISRKTYDTGMTKLGCFIGDHTKTGIGTLIPTGAVIGSFVNFFGGGMMPRYVKDFTWLTSTKKEVYDLQKALQTARTVMERRGITMSSSYQTAIKDCYSWRNT